MKSQYLVGDVDIEDLKEHVLLLTKQLCQKANFEKSQEPSPTQEGLRARILGVFEEIKQEEQCNEKFITDALVHFPQIKI